jgi:hypothetical protein
MWEKILLNSISPAAVLIAVWITSRFNERRRKSEEKRWLADYYLNKKIDSLMSLYSTLYDAYQALNHYGNIYPKTDKIFRLKVESSVDRFYANLHIASIYLDQKEEEILRKCIGSFRQASQAIYINLPDEELPQGLVKNSYDPKIRDVDFPGLRDSYINAIDLLKKNLWPKAIRDM